MWNMEHGTWGIERGVGTESTYQFSVHVEWTPTSNQFPINLIIVFFFHLSFQLWQEKIETDYTLVIDCRSQIASRQRIDTSIDWEIGAAVIRARNCYRSGVRKVPTFTWVIKFECKWGRIMTSCTSYDVGILFFFLSVGDIVHPWCLKTADEGRALKYYRISTSLRYSCGEDLKAQELKGWKAKMLVQEY